MIVGQMVPRPSGKSERDKDSTALLPRMGSGDAQSRNMAIGGKIGAVSYVEGSRELVMRGCHGDGSCEGKLWLKSKSG